MNEEHAIRRAIEMASEGADIVDIGGESTRPGSESVPMDIELERVIPVIKALAGKINIPLSIDTYKAEVAEEALKSGASMVNDITGLRGDSNMAKVVAKFQVPVVLMHIQGTPKTMQQDIRYHSLIEDIIESLKASIDIALDAGISRSKIIIDPGIGFGKTREHNLEILNRLDEFKVLARPILIGTSRKSFIVNTLKEANIDEEFIESNGRLMGTAASSAIAVLKGANILRAHDVEEIVQVARIADAVKRMN